MSVLTLQFGQCGNQIGYEWYSTLAKDLYLHDQQEVPASRQKYVDEGLERWFKPLNKKNKYVARSILVDTEQKVIKDIWDNHLTSQTWRYNIKNVICPKDGGAANNWAFGYSCKGRELLDLIMNRVRKETEQCDHFSSFLNILSCAGGTGSGVGSYIIEHIKDEYPSKTMMNVVVFPYKSGEVVTQDYNAFLTLAKVYDISDMHIIFQNDHLHSMCCKLMRTRDITFSDINSIAAMKLCSVLQPVKHVTHNYLCDLVCNLTPHPSYKLVTVKTAPHIPRNTKSEYFLPWHFLSKHMMRLLRVSTLKKETLLDWELQVPSARTIAVNSLMKYVKCIANVLITRGSGDVDQTDIEQFKEPQLYPDWVPVHSCFHHYHENQELLNVEKFISLICNNTCILDHLNHLAKRAWNRFQSKAFLHQYEKFSIGEEEISLAFAKIEDTIHNYSELQ